MTSDQPNCGCQSGCGDTATSPVAPVASQSDEGLVQSRWHIAALCCPTEERVIRNRLESIGAVKQLRFSMLERQLSVSHLPEGVSEIERALDQIGMPGRRLDNAADSNNTDPQPDSSSILGGYMRLGLAGLAALGAEIAHLAELGEWPALGMALLALLLCGVETYRKGWLALRQRDLNINALMTIAVTSAMLIGEWPEAAMVMVLFTLSEVIEAKSLARARDAIRGLMALAPDSARVEQQEGQRGVQASGQWRQLPAAQVRLGQRVKVLPGEKIPLDGVVVDGVSAVNQAPVTGESLPVDKAIGDNLFAGTLNETGVLVLEVTARADNSTIARIIHAVEQAQSERAPMQRFVDRFARIYTPAVLGLAALVALLAPLLLGWAWIDAIYRALVLLVIACPCALVISTPVTIVSGLARAARNGVLIKGGLYLELGAQLQTIAFDKTGTLTEGRPSVVEQIPVSDGVETEGLEPLAMAVALARHSNHPISQAVARFGDELAAFDSARGDDFDRAEARLQRFHTEPGCGVSAQLTTDRYSLGNHRWLHQRGGCSAELEQQLEALERQGRTVVVLSRNDRPLLLLAIVDQPKDHATEALMQLQRQGITSWMLSGDNRHSVASIATELGVQNARGELLPQHKLEVLKQLKVGLQGSGGKVAMVGDGINDTPALASADIGFAMAAAGTDSAMEIADVALMDDNLQKLPWFVALSRRTTRLLKQNIALALAIKAVFMLLALSGQATLWMAVFADMGASLLVVFNGLRLLRFDD